MDVNRTFGVEIEMSASVGRAEVAALLRQALSSVGHTCRAQGYSHQINEFNTTEWMVETDASVRSVSTDHPHTMEVKTPVLKGVEGLKALKIASSVLSTVGHINKSCGLHVHHFVKNSERGDHLRNVCRAWLENEKYFMMCVPKSRQTSSYCKQWVPQHPSALTSHQDPVRWFRDNFGGSRCRKSTLNVYSVALRNTLEFRLHSGTYEFEKICNWLVATQRFIVKAMRGDFVFQKSSSFDDFIIHMETDFDPESLTAHIEAIPEGAHTQAEDLTMLTAALIHPDAKKQKLPRPGTKTYTIANMLLQGATKKQIVDALDDEFGSIGSAKQTKYVSGQLTNMKNPKYSWGFRIQKNRSTGKFRIVPHEGTAATSNPVMPVVNAPAPEAHRSASKLDLRSLNWLKSRREYFAAQRATEHRERRSRRSSPVTQDIAEAIGLDGDE